jgi:hypothetical protein
MARWLGLVMTALVLTGCYYPPRGGVSPAPPGPVDALNIVFRNDYSRLCPERYEYCRAGKRSICCPTGSCCDDGNGPYCCDTRGYAYDDRNDGRSRYDGAGDRGPCGARATTCSRGGETICCADDEGCCADSQGLYCCAARSGRGGY